MGILVLKSIHIISFVAWFAGLFYLVRLLISHSEAQKKAKPEKDILINQFRVMERKAYKVVCNPAMMITWICGLLILHFYGLEWLKENPWMHIKLLLLTLLTIYHVWMGKQMKKMQNQDSKYSGYNFRVLNIVLSVFLITIILLAVIRDMAHVGKIIGLVILVGILLFLSVRKYKEQRETH